jgi:phenylacetate-CoA ligase
MNPEQACPCGRGLPLIGDIQGRVQSIILGTDGQYLPSSFFLHYLKDFDYAIQKFQIVQERLGAIRFRFVKGGRFSDDVLAEVLRVFRQYLGQDMAIDCERVEEIEMVRTGKRLASMSCLGIDFQNGAAPTLKSERPQ